MSTLHTVQRLLIKEFGVAQDQVHAEAKLDELGIDSLAQIEVMFFLEDEFKLRSPEEPVAVKTVGEIANQIDFLIAQQRSPADKDSAVDP